MGQCQGKDAQGKNRDHAKGARFRAGHNANNANEKTYEQNSIVHITISFMLGNIASLNTRASG
jgi:hypothetical protein